MICDERNHNDTNDRKLYVITLIRIKNSTTKILFTSILIVWLLLRVQEHTQNRSFLYIIYYMYKKYLFSIQRQFNKLIDYNYIEKNEKIWEKMRKPNKK